MFPDIRTVWSSIISQFLSVKGKSSSWKSSHMASRSGPSNPSRSSVSGSSVIINCEKSYVVFILPEPSWFICCSTWML